MANTSASQVPRPSLAVVRQHFIEGLRLVAGVRGLGSKSVVFSFAEGQFFVEMGSLTFRCDANGHWPGQALVLAKYLRQLAKEPPTGSETIDFTVCDGEMRLSSASGSSSTR